MKGSHRKGRGFRRRLKVRKPFALDAPGASIEIELLCCRAGELRLSFEAPDGVTIVREEVLRRPAARAQRPQPRRPERSSPARRRLMLSRSLGEAVLLLGRDGATGPAWQVRITAERVGVISGDLRIKAPPSVRFDHGGQAPKAAA
jgi:sRNA-binding carbon storage regulator CsrA